MEKQHEDGGDLCSLASRLCSLRPETASAALHEPDGEAAPLGLGAVQPQGLPRPPEDLNPKPAENHSPP